MSGTENRAKAQAAMRAAHPVNDAEGHISYAPRGPEPVHTVEEWHALIVAAHKANKPAAELEPMREGMRAAVRLRLRLAHAGMAARMSPPMPGGSSGGGGMG